MVGEAFHKIEIVGRWFGPSALLIAGAAVNSWIAILVSLIYAILMNIDALRGRTSFWKPLSRKVSALIVIPVALAAAFVIPDPLAETHLPLLGLLLGYGFFLSAVEGYLQFADEE